MGKLQFLGVAICGLPSVWSMKWWICDENKRTFLSCKLPKNWNFSKSFKDKIQKSTDGNPLIATPENCNLPINCNFFLQPNQAYYKSG